MGPQVIGWGMDRFGANGFAYALAAFFVFYVILSLSRIIFVKRRG